MLGVTAHPNAEWIARQLTEACGWSEPPRYIIRDRDSAYGKVFIRRLRAMGIRDRPISARSPWQNGCAERLIGSIRRECLDHVVVFGEQHLRHLLSSYKQYYNEVCTRVSLKKIPRCVQREGGCSPCQSWVGFTIGTFEFEYPKAPAKAGAVQPVKDRSG
jgi:transposase InsO family protein